MKIVRREEYDQHACVIQHVNGEGGFSAYIEGIGTQCFTLSDVSDCDRGLVVVGRRFLLEEGMRDENGRRERFLRLCFPERGAL